MIKRKKTQRRKRKKNHTHQEIIKRRLYLFQRNNTHQLPDAGDIGVTETQQGEQSVSLSNDTEEDMIQSV